MARRSHLRMADVVVLDDHDLLGEQAFEAPTSDGVFELFVDRDGLTLHLMAVPAIERRWLWSSVQGFKTTPAGEPQSSRLRSPGEGRRLTSLDLKVDGRPLRLLVPADQLPEDRLAALQRFVDRAAQDAQCPEEVAPPDPPAADQAWRYPPRTTRPSNTGQRIAAAVTVVGAAVALGVMAVSNSGSPPISHATRIAAPASSQHAPATAPGAPGATSPATAPSSGTAGAVASGGIRARTVSGASSAGGASAQVAPARTTSASAPVPPAVSGSTSTPGAPSPPAPPSPPPPAPPSPPSAPPPPPLVGPGGLIGPGGLVPTPPLPLPPVSVPGVTIAGGRDTPLATPGSPSSPGSVSSPGTTGSTGAAP